MARPFVELLRELPKNFPELQDTGIAGRIFRDVLLPQVIVLAKKDEARTRSLVVGVVQRCIRALELDPAEVVGNPQRLS